MSRSAELPVRRFLAEGVVIVASILLAFAVDAAWERRGEGQRREALLVALDRDLVAVEAEMARVGESRARARDAAAEVLSRVQRGEVRESAESELRQLVWDLTYPPTFDAPLGAVAALLAGGNLELLADSALARSITSLPAAVADLDREQSRAADYVDRFFHALAQLGYMSTNLGGPDPVPWEVHPGGLGTYLEDPVVVDQVANLWYSHRETGLELEGVREVVSSLRARLRVR